MTQTFFQRGEYVQHVKTGQIYQVLADYRIERPTDARVACIRMVEFEGTLVPTMKAKYQTLNAAKLTTHQGIK